MNWQMPGLPGMTEPSLVQGGQEMLTWGATPVQVYQDRCTGAVTCHYPHAELQDNCQCASNVCSMCQRSYMCSCASDCRTSSNAEQPQTTQSPPVLGGKPQAAATSGHVQRDRHVSWVWQGAQEPPADDDLPDQHQNVEWRGAAALDSPGSQGPDMSANVVPPATALTQLRLQDSSQPALYSASGLQQLAPNEVQQAEQHAAQATPPPAAAPPMAQSQPAPTETASTLQPAQAASSSLQRAATPAVTRRWVRPKPVQQRSWDDSTQSMGTVMRRKLPPAPPRVTSRTNGCYSNNCMHVVVITTQCHICVLQCNTIRQMGHAICRQGVRSHCTARRCSLRAASRS